MPSSVELIKERLNIADIVGSYIKLEKSGSNLKAKCPFHNEKTPSFFVSPDRGSYYCFGCSAKGDIFSFVQAFEGLDFIGALRILATRAGVEIVRENPKARSERERLFALMDLATVFFSEKLAENSAARRYLQSRGLSDETVMLWRLGFAPDAWQECVSHCHTRGFSEKEIENAGLVKTENKKTYDRFRSRIMFPLFDSASRVVAFSGRIFGKEGENIPKYLNSPETSIFSKSKILYGFDRAKIEIRKKDFAMLVEGQVDLLMCHQAGFKNTVASSGTAFTEEQLTLLRRLSKRLLMVYDADAAGVKASLRSASLALSAGMEVKVTALPSGTDPAELIASDISQWRESLKSSMHIIDFYLESILKEKLDARALSKAIRERLLPYIAVLESSIERDHFIASVSSKTGIRDVAIREDLARIKTPARIVSNDREQETRLSPRRNFAERLLVGLVLWQRRTPDNTFDVNLVERDIARILGDEAATALIEEAHTIEDELIFQAESYYSNVLTRATAVTDLLVTLEEDTLSTALAIAMQELTEAERSKDASLVTATTTRCQELTQKRNAVRQKRHV